MCPYKLDHKDLTKMLASTVQFSSYGRSHTFTAPTRVLATVVAFFEPA